MVKEYVDYSLLHHNTFGIDVSADKFVEYTSVKDLKHLFSGKDFQKNSCLHIGAGSNLLFVSDYHGIILHSGIKGMEIIRETNEEVYIRVGAGETWDNFVAYCVNNGWGGAENLSLIPGEVGASVVQNIGAYGAEVKDLVEQVEVVEISTTEEKSFTNAGCNFSYRQSIFKNEWKNKCVVTYVTYKLSKRPVFKLEYGNIKEELAKYEQVNLYTIRRAIISIRENKLPDPKVEGSAGSFFMNPIISRTQFDFLRENYPEIPYYIVDRHLVKVPAGWLIDQCGWKGKTLGRAGVHSKQALVLVNKGGATGDEILALSQAIRVSVREKFEIDIYPEVNFIG